jgi:hypothetical protein
MSVILNDSASAIVPAAQPTINKAIISIMVAHSMATADELTFEEAVSDMGNDIAYALEEVYGEESCDHHFSEIMDCRHLRSAVKRRVGNTVNAEVIENIGNIAYQEILEGTRKIMTERLASILPQLIADARARAEFTLNTVLEQYLKITPDPVPAEEGTMVDRVEEQDLVSPSTPEEVAAAIRSRTILDREGYILDEIDCILNPDVTESE